MSNITRISISIEEDLLERFDSFSNEQGFPTRSEAIKNVMRDALIQREWSQGMIVAGAISLVYDHHKSNVVQKLLHVQHDFYTEIQCSQHVHLDHSNCMEIIVVRGVSEKITELLKRLRETKGLKQIVLTASTTGEYIH